MKFHTNFCFLKDKKVIQPGKVLIFGNWNILISTAFWSWQKNLFHWYRIFQIVVSGGGEANSPQWGASVLLGDELASFWLAGGLSSTENSLMCYFLVYIIHYSCLYDSAKTACFGKIFLELYTKMLSANQIAKSYKF